MRVFGIVLGSLMLFVACTGGSDVSGDRRVVGGSSVVFTVRPPRVEVGNSVRLAIRLTNNTGRIENLKFPSGQQYDFWITKADKEVWRWSDEQSFIQAVTTKELGPQESLTFAETWITEEAGSFIAHASVQADRYEGDLTGKVDVGG